MPRLHTLDAVWLEMEHAGPPIATGLVSVMDGPAPSVVDVRRMVADRLDDLPSLRWVLTPGHGLHRPEWRDGGAPDLTHHVWSRRIGSGPESLEAFVSSVMDRPMQRSRPLWEIALARGLADQRWAFVWRLHHAVADGQGSQIMLGHLFDTRPDGSRRMAHELAAFRPNVGRAGTPEPSSPRSIAAHTASAAVGGLLSAIRHLPEAAHLLADLTPRPPGPVTGPLSDRRRWVLGAARLDSAKALARGFGVTVNDVILAAVAAGFGELLRSRSQSTDRTLRCVLPVSLRPIGDDDADNNVSLAWTDLPVGDLSLGDRARRIHRSTAWQKEFGTPRVASVLYSLSDHLVPGPVQEAVVSHAGWVPEWMTDTLVTNVPGAPFPLYILGRRMRLSYPIIPADGHLRIIVGVVSHDGWLCIGVTGDAVHAGDVDVLRDGMVRALTVP